MPAFDLFQGSPKGALVDVRLVDAVARRSLRIVQEFEVQIVLDQAESCPRELTRLFRILRDRYRRHDHLPELALVMFLPGIAERFEERADASRIAPDATELRQRPAV